MAVGDDGERRRGERLVNLPAYLMLTPMARGILAKYRKPQADRNVLGKIWNSPNTALGTLVGLAGHGVGKVMGKNPRIRVRDNAIQFTNNPVGGVSAITLGNTVIWNGDPYDPKNSKGPLWPDPQNAIEHEKQHTYQGEQLGPIYLPSNVLGGLNSVVRGEGWHGAGNWNETGPLQNPPRPWPVTKP